MNGGFRLAAIQISNEIVSERPTAGIRNDTLMGLKGALSGRPQIIFFSIMPK